MVSGGGRSADIGASLPVDKEIGEEKYQLGNLIPRLSFSIAPYSDREAVFSSAWRTWCDLQPTKIASVSADTWANFGVTHSTVTTLIWIIFTARRSFFADGSNKAVTTFTKKYIRHVRISLAQTAIQAGTKRVTRNLFLAENSFESTVTYCVLVTATECFISL